MLMFGLDTRLGRGGGEALDLNAGRAAFCQRSGAKMSAEDEISPFDFAFLPAFLEAKN